MCLLYLLYIHNRIAVECKVLMCYKDGSFSVLFKINHFDAVYMQFYLLIATFASKIIRIRVWTHNGLEVTLA